MQKFEFEVIATEAGMRLDKFLMAKIPDITRNRIQALIKQHTVFDEQRIPFPSGAARTKTGQKISVIIPDPKPCGLKPKKINFEIVFEDDDLLVINKPANLTVHPGAGNHCDTLVNALLFTHQGRLSEISGELRPGIVHRLDRDTTGLMLVAKNDLAHRNLVEQLQKREVKRNYLAFIYGAMDPLKGRIEGNIARSNRDRTKMTVSQNRGRCAITNYETKEIFLGGFISLVECRLATGRTHQIRLHLEWKKHSLIGDKTYNSCKKTAPQNLDEETKTFIENFPRQALHSYKIGFLHPRTGKEMSFEIPLPEDLKKLQDLLVQNKVDRHL